MAPWGRQRNRTTPATAFLGCRARLGRSVVPHRGPAERRALLVYRQRARGCRPASRHGRTGRAGGSGPAPGAFLLFEPEDIYTAAVPLSPEALMNVFSEGISAALL